MRRSTMHWKTRCLTIRCRVHDALRQRRRAAREGEAEQLVVGEGDVDLLVAPLRQRLLVDVVAAGGVDPDRALQRRHVDRRDHLGVAVGEEQHLRRGRPQQRLQLRPCEAEVERHVDGAELGAGEQHLHVLRRVGREQRDAVALADAHRAQPRREAGSRAR